MTTERKRVDLSRFDNSAVFDPGAGVVSGCATQARDFSTDGYLRNHCSLRRGSIGTSARSL